MKVVKLTRKSELDEIVATLTLRLGHKVTQQDVLDASIMILMENIEMLEKYFSEGPELTGEKIKRIMALAEEIPYETRRSIDQDVYGEK